LILFISSQIIQTRYYNWFLNGYFDDLLFFPFVLSFIKIVKNDFKITWKFLTIVYISISILFEILLPIWSQNQTGDPFDFIAYLIGVIIFLKINKQAPLSRK
jgi:hypothetical protein